MRFKAERVREHDENGQLVKTGLIWNEEMTNVVFFGIIVAGIGGTGLFFVWMFVSTSDFGHDAAYDVGLISALIVAAGIALMTLFNRRKRGFIFHADGRMNSPYPLPGYLLRRKVRGHHRDIMSIEQKPLRDGNNVVALISVGGDTVWLSKNMADWEALKVAVQLTHALSELRESQISASERSTIPRPVVQRTTDKALIT